MPVLLQMWHESLQMPHDPGSDMIGSRTDAIWDETDSFCSRTVAFCGETDAFGGEADACCYETDDCGNEWDDSFGNPGGFEDRVDGWGIADLLRLAQKRGAIPPNLRNSGEFRYASQPKPPGFRRSHRSSVFSFREPQ